MHDAWKIIDEIGSQLGASEGARLKWRQRGVPHRMRLPIVMEAKGRGLSIDPEDFEGVANRRRRRAFVTAPSPQDHAA